MISVDPNYMRQTVDNLVINAINFSDKGLITVKVKKEGVAKKLACFTLDKCDAPLSGNELIFFGDKIVGLTSRYEPQFGSC